LGYFLFGYGLVVMYWFLEMLIKDGRVGLTRWRSIMLVMSFKGNNVNIFKYLSTSESADLRKN